MFRRSAPRQLLGGVGLLVNYPMTPARGVEVVNFDKRDPFSINYAVQMASLVSLLSQMGFIGGKKNGRLTPGPLPKGI